MTINEAKKLYFKYDCSLFSMAREEKNSYEEYRALNIPREIEEKWSQELFIILWEELKEIKKSVLFNRMYHLAENLHNKEILIILKEALNCVRYDNLEVKLSISETIIGRKDIDVRSGMIFWAYDLGEKELSKELLEFVFNLLDNEKNGRVISPREARVIKKCIMIDDILRLGVYDKNNI